MIRTSLAVETFREDTGLWRPESLHPLDDTYKRRCRFLWWTWEIEDTVMKDVEGQKKCRIEARTVAEELMKNVGVGPGYKHVRIAVNKRGSTSFGPFQPFDTEVVWEDGEWMRWERKL